MEDFLLNYVEEMAEVRDQEINRTQLCIIVDSIMENDELWDTIDSLVIAELNKIKEVK